MPARKCANIIFVVAVVALTATFVGGSKKKVTCDNCARCAGKEIKRVGMVVGLKRDMEAKYRELHADGHPGVRDLLSKYGMQNFSIFLTEIDGKLYEFGYYEYVGDDFEKDMAAMDKEPRTVEWLKMCDPMQQPLPGEKSWRQMERVYFNP
jgi:L-rhamnose mutarotase